MEVKEERENAEETLIDQINNVSELITNGDSRSKIDLLNNILCFHNDG